MQVAGYAIILDSTKRALALRGYHLAHIVDIFGAKIVQHLLLRFIVDGQLLMVMVILG